MRQSASGSGPRPPGGPGPSWSADSLLGSIDAAGQRALLGLGRPCRYPAEATLMCQGGSDTHVVLLRAGTVKVTATSEKGDVTLLAIRVPGDVVGEMAATGCGPRSATVTASSPVTGNTIMREDFQAFLGAHPAVALGLSRMLGMRLLRANERRVEFASYPVKVRLARVLTEFGRQLGRQTPRGISLDVKLTQAELAGITGASISAIQTAFRELRADGLAETVYGRITIHRPAELESVAGFHAADTPAANPHF